ncbi:histone-like nucleoid-structuring protein Lsr2 [Nocardia bovistercoris]|uniref:Lsr2 family protein n=1 Tax=Nocardia bovistercoris TaxID=2785916 RepID=A0A931N3G8_9NOCA|nr:Lsr2 family protein [Nocardia bovistercoris]MBH0777844.1 Lsr2 family protein [Nocardia bovistercoris]
MAKTTVVVTKDDWTGEIVDTTDIAPKQITSFTFNGREYCLDLSAASAEELQATLAPWIEKASQVNVVGRRTRQTKPAAETATVETTAEDRAAIREWARDNGFDVGPRGRIPDAVIRAYHESPDEDEDEAFEDEVATSEADVEVSGVDDAKPTAAERAAIRQWAQEQGLEVKSRGPLSPDLIRDYRETHAA